MWCSSYASVFTKVANGMKTSELAHIAQLLPKFEMGKNYTIVLSINNVVYKETDKFYYSLSRETSEKGNLSMIAIKLSANDILNYANLFEGDIAYPHVKENYATALMRCLPYIEYGEYVCVGSGYWIKGVDFKTKKNGIPTYVFINASDGNGFIQDKLGFRGINMYGAPFVCLDNANSPASAEKYSGSVLVVRVIFTCEPL